MRGRPGVVSVPELALVCWAFSLVLLALAQFVGGQGRLARRQSALVRLQDARRTIEVILGSEVRALATPDLRLAGPEAVHVRAVRGSGVVCSAANADVEVRYRGVRRPDPEKDSVLLVGTQGEQALGVSAVRAAGCGGSPDGLTITVDRAPTARAGFALVYEPGSYHAAEGALRYRLGRGGRQPLTEAIFQDVAFRAGPGAAGLALALRPHADSVGHGPPLLFRFPSLNPPAP